MCPAGRRRGSQPTDWTCGDGIVSGMTALGYQATQIAQGKRRPHPSMKAIRNAKLIEFYLAGHSMKQTGKAFGVSTVRVFSILADNRIATRRPGRPRAS